MSESPVERALLVERIRAGDVTGARAALTTGPATRDLAVLAVAVARLSDDADDAATRAADVLADPELDGRTAAQLARALSTGSVWGLPASRRPHLDATLLPAACDAALRATALSPGRPDAWTALGEALAGLGRTREAREAWSAAASLDPARRRQVLAARLADGDVEGAAALLPDACAAAPDDAVLARQAADVAVQTRAPGADADVLRALTLDPDAWPWAVDRLVTLGALDAAHGAIPAGPVGDPHRARLALWAGDDAAAASLAAGPDPLARLVRGALAARRGDPAGHDDLAAAHASAGTPGTPPWLRADEPLAWRAHLHRRTGDRDAAVRAAVAAITSSERWHLPAAIERLLAVLDPARDAGPLDPWAWRPLADALEDLFPTAGRSGVQADVRTALESALCALGGNRSATPTRVVDGALVARPTPPHVRHEARRIQHRLRFHHADAVLDAYARLRQAWPDHPVAHTYTGELLLWLGRYDDAAQHLDHARALDRTTVWAWIGRGACDLLRGDPRAALAVWEEGVATCRFEGPTLFPLRAEARWRLGELAAARTDVEHALRAKPGRASAWILRALVGGEPDGVARTAAAVRRTLPGLWVDAREAGDDDVATLDRALARMRGNRSSTMVTWFGPDGSGPRTGFPGTAR